MSVYYDQNMELTIDLTSIKWKLLILWHLSKETLRFSELNGSYLKLHKNANTVIKKLRK